MTPQVYCARLERALSLMPAAERQETIRYYLEFLEYYLLSNLYNTYSQVCTMF